MFDEDIILSAGALAVFATMLTALVGALTAMFGMLLKAKEAELAATRDQRDQYLRLARNSLLALERAWRTQRAEAGLPTVTLPPPDPSLPPEDLQARLDAVAAALAHGGLDG